MFYAVLLASLPASHDADARAALALAAARPANVLPPVRRAVGCPCGCGAPSCRCAGDCPAQPPAAPAPAAVVAPRPAAPAAPVTVPMHSFAQPAWTQFAPAFGGCPGDVCR